MPRKTQQQTDPGDINAQLQAALAAGDMAEVARLAALQAEAPPPAEEPAPEPDFVADIAVEEPSLEAAAEAMAGGEDPDDEFERMFAEQAQAAGDDDEEMWDTDWSPDQGLHEEGWHPAVFANIDKGSTRANDPAVEWAFTIIETGRTLKRKINLKGGNGIERINVQFAAAFGVHPVETPSGRQFPGGQLRKLIGTKVEVEIKHRPHWSEKDRMIEDLVGVRPYSDGVDLG